MTSYVIKAAYTTGDSFHTEETSDILGIVWKDIEIAKRALRLLKEHHDFYKKQNDRWYKGSITDVDMENIQIKSWYITPEKTFYKDMWQYSLLLPVTETKNMQISIPYHGYFEHLHSLEITIDSDSEDTDMRVTF